MSNNYNLENHLQLLKKQDLTKTDKRQLRSYGALVELQISYNRKDTYFALIKNFLAKKISPGIFRAEFLEMQNQDDDTAKTMKKDFEQLANLSVNLESEEGPFSLLIDLIYDNSMLAIEFGPEDGISEEEFEVSIEKIVSNSKFFK